MMLLERENKNDVTLPDRLDYLLQKQSPCTKIHKSNFPPTKYSTSDSQFQYFKYTTLQRIIFMFLLRVVKQTDRYGIYRKNPRHLIR